MREVGEGEEGTSRLDLALLGSLDAIISLDCDSMCRMSLTHEV